MECIRCKEEITLDVPHFACSRHSGVAVHYACKDKWKKCPICSSDVVFVPAKDNEERAPQEKAHDIEISRNYNLQGPRSDGPTILITGYGNIGRHLYNELRPLSRNNFDIYDINQEEFEIKPKRRHNFEFICVPTDSNPDGSADISIVEEAVSRSTADIIVIKSTVPVGTVDILSVKYKKKIVFSPEYYGTTIHAPQAPNFLILGGRLAIASKVAQLYYRVKNGSYRIKFTTAHIAELAKYMENCFLALKVTFCAEFAGIASSYDISYEALREIFIMDERMGDSHTFVYEDKPYYDSHSLNKDIPALIAQAGKYAPLMQAMHSINLKKKDEYL